MVLGGVRACSTSWSESPGPRAQRVKIRKYQISTKLLIPQLPFQRLLREIAREIHPEVRFTSQAVLAIQEAAEAHLVQSLENANLCALHDGRVTLLKKDMDLMRRGRRF